MHHRPVSSSSDEDEDLAKFASVAVTGDDIKRGAEPINKKVRILTPWNAALIAYRHFVF